MFCILLIILWRSSYSHSSRSIRLQITKHRDMVLDLGNGLKTNARLNLPATGDGPFPGVLLVPGSGPIDMNETIGAVRIDNETGSIIYPPARPFFDIAQYLSERGFAVLQYDKRGIGANSTTQDWSTKKSCNKKAVGGDTARHHYNKTDTVFVLHEHDSYTEVAMYSYHYHEYKYGEGPEVTFDMKDNIYAKYKHN
jgi:hypothetical protein